MLDILLIFLAIKAAVTAYSAFRAMTDIVETVEHELS